MTAFPVLEIVLATILIVVCVALGLLAWQRLRRRREQLTKEIHESQASVEERAYNRLHIARSAADHLERGGIDVGGPRQLIHQASEAYDSGHHDDALALASSAHDALLERAKASPSALPATPATASAGSSPPPSIPTAMPPALDAGSSDDAPPAAPPRLPKNKAESHFQLTLLDEELAGGGPPGTSSGTLAGVRAIATEARAAYDRADFTESLRLGLKGRRTLGARVESLPVTTPSAEPEATEPGPAPVAADGVCGRCGQPVRSADQFCRGCGAAVGATKCARCGDPLDASDRFCGRCGTPKP